MLVSSRRPRAETKKAFSAPRTSAGAGLAEVELQPVRGLLAERHDAVLAPLAMYVDGFLFEVHVRQVQPYGLRRTKPRRVDELEQRPVAKR